MPVLHRFLLGAMQQAQVAMTVRHLGTPDDVARLPQIIEAWRRASARMQELLRDEAGVAELTTVEDPPRELAPRLEQIGEDPLFRATFSDMPTTFKVIDIDNLVAPQRDVNLDYVGGLRARLPGRAVADLVDFCVGPRRETPEIKVLQTAQNQMTFSSPSLNLIFLGGFPKPLTEDDVRVAHMGGQPVEAVTLLIGFGAAPINAWFVGHRLVLANGFHRIVALRSEGITRIPIVLRQVTNPEIEFPEQFLGLSRSYLLQTQRPVMLKDFFDERLTLELKLKTRRKTLKVTWIPEEGTVPD